MILLFIDNGLQEPSLLKVNLHTPDTGTFHTSEIIVLMKL